MRQLRAPRRLPSLLAASVLAQASTAHSDTPFNALWTWFASPDTDL